MWKRKTDYVSHEGFCPVGVLFIGIFNLFIGEKRALHNGSVIMAFNKFDTIALRIISDMEVNAIREWMFCS